MTIGDCYILSSDFHKIDIGIIFIGETKTTFYFTPLNFINHKFDKTLEAVYNGKLQTNKILSGSDLHEVTGIFTINELKKQPSFLTEYCKTNKPFINLNLNTEKIILGQSSKSPDQIIIGGGTNFPKSKEIFDKFHIQPLTNYSWTTPEDIDLILKSK
jgi:hypothetical protein